MKFILSLIKLLAISVFFLGTLLATLWAFGPRDEIPTQPNYQTLHVPGDLSAIDEWLKRKESLYADMLPGVAKQIIWHKPEAKTKTAWAVVYLHGFSATLSETRPMPDLIAEALGANLYFTRLRGHGRGGDAMLDGSVQSWLDDAAEAIEIGRSIGDRVLVIGVSTGGTLAGMVAVEGHFADSVAGWIMVSPNFAVKAEGSELLTAPWAKSWVPLLVGDTRSWEPQSELHGQYWTTTYPNLALLPMAASVKVAASLDYSVVQQPALFVFSDKDQVVDAAKSREIADRWGAGAELQVVNVGEGDDPFHHVIAGDILSPGMTASIVEGALQWVRKLPDVRSAKK